MEKKLQERKKHVDSFIKSFLLHKKLEEVAGYDEEADYSTSVKPVEMNPYDEELEEGQIRLLPHTERITYVVLLKRWNAKSFLVMPFSRYSFPATDEEFITGFDGGFFLKVLQAWNTRTLQDETLKKSWLIGFLPQEDLDDAWKMWEATLNDITLDDNLLKKTGLPIYRKIDPRVEYKREELDNFARTDAEDLEASYFQAKPSANEDEKAKDEFIENSVVSFSSITPITLWTQKKAALAAGKERKNIQLAFKVSEPNVSVYIEFSHQNKLLTVDVYDDQQTLSIALDGCMVMDIVNTTALGVIQGGHLEVTFDESICSITLIDPKGQAIEGELIKEG